jgi:hypothetical protein
MTRNRANDEARAELTARRPFRGRRARPRQAGPVRNSAFRRLRSAAAGPAAIATVLVALTAAFGGEPASAANLHADQRAARVAPARPAVVTGVTWHALSLRNGWRSDQATWNSGNPSWAVKGGVVYLSGSLHQSAGPSVEFAVLPPAARPRHKLWITTYTYLGAVGSLLIMPSGVMWVSSNPGNAAGEYTSLAAISYPLGS